MIKTISKHTTPRTFGESDFLFEKRYTIRYSEIDQYGLITPLALWSYLLDTSMLHVKANKFSYLDLKTLGVTWAIRRAHLHVDRCPTVGENITIKTYSHSTRRYFTCRDYKVYDDKGELIAWMSSEWLLMGTRDRALRDIENTVGKLPDNTNESLLTPLSYKLRAPQELDFKEPLEVKCSYIDFNGHVNNSNYLRWMLDQVPEPINRKLILSDFYIQYRKEILEGQKIVTGCKVNHGHDLLHTITDTQGDVLSIAKSLWRSRP